MSVRGHVFFLPFCGPAGDAGGACWFAFVSCARCGPSGADQGESLDLEDHVGPRPAVAHHGSEEALARRLPRL